MNAHLRRCDRCGKSVGTNEWDIHTCTPPAPVQQEPVADVRAYAYSGVAKNGEFFEAVLREGAKVADGDKLYTSPQPAQRKPLTKAQREEIYLQWGLHNWTPEEVIQAIEKALGTKENT